MWFCGGLVFARLTGCILPLPLFLLPQSLGYIYPAVLCVQRKELTFSTLCSGPKRLIFLQQVAVMIIKPQQVGVILLKTNDPLLKRGVVLHTMGELSTQTASSAIRPEQNFV